ncbi:MAG TPA: hypothetical protein VNS63_22390, partial [Blastocatellia bacterium]|nr:hypothetical protein [Blastocatellia bacterium]
MKSARAACLLLLVSSLAVPFSSSMASTDESVFERIKREHEFVEKNLHQVEVKAKSIAMLTNKTAQPIDVKHYRLQIRLSPDVPDLAGTVTISAETRSQLPTMSIDAEDNLTIDAVRFDGSPQDFKRMKSRIDLNFPEPLAASRSFQVAIDYHGFPVISNILG